MSYRRPDSRRCHRLFFLGLPKRSAARVTPGLLVMFTRLCIQMSSGYPGTYLKGANDQVASDFVTSIQIGSTCHNSNSSLGTFLNVPQSIQRPSSWDQWQQYPARETCLALRSQSSGSPIPNQGCECWKSWHQFVPAQEKQPQTTPPTGRVRPIGSC